MKHALRFQQPKFLFTMQERISNIAYNIVNGLCTPISDQSAPVYITIGDGGNLEGLVTKYVWYKKHCSTWKEFFACFCINWNLPILIGFYNSAA